MLLIAKHRFQKKHLRYLHSKVLNSLATAAALDVEYSSSLGGRHAACYSLLTRSQVGRILRLGITGIFILLHHISCQSKVASRHMQVNQLRAAIQ